MKKSILILSSLVLMALNTFSQATYNLVMFAEDGDAFYLYANGIRQNDKPETNVKITGLTSQALSVRVEFENKALPQLKKTWPMEPGNEYTVRIKKDLKKQMKLQYFGQVPLADAPKSDASVVQYHTAENAMDNSTASNSNTGSNNQFNTSTSTGNGNVNTSVTTTSTTTQISTGTNINPNGAVGVNVNVNGLGINMNVNDPNMQTTTSYTTTTTTTSSSSSSNSQPKKHNYENQSNPTTMPVENSQPASVGCKGAMSDVNFQKMKKSVEDKPFSDTKMSTAKVATKNACLSVQQIKDICSLFSMDEDKLAYAKYAYNSCTDKASFYQVSEIFSFSSTTDELNKFIEQQ